MPSTTESSSWLVAFRCICCINNKWISFYVKDRALFMEEGCKDLIQIWIGDCAWVCWQQLPPPWLLLLRSINAEEGGGSSHGSRVTSGTPPERGTDVKSSHGFKRRQQCSGWEVFWGGTSSVQCRRSLSWNRWKNIEENYRACLPCIHKMYRILFPRSSPVTTAGETLNKSW